MSEQRNNGQRRNNNRNRNNNNRNRNNNNRNRPARHRAPRPLKLTGWQKFLKMIGLFNEQKARKKQQENDKRNQANKKNSAARSNTRVAKQRKPHQPVPVETPRLYVGNLSYDATDFDIEELFKGIGTVKKVEIIYNRHTHKSRGYGFVQMLNVEEAKRAVEVLHDQPFLGRNLIVNGSKARKESDRSGELETANAE